MSEIQDLVQIYGEIDLAVQANPEELAPSVSRLLPAYREGAGHWFESFREWTKDLVSERGGDPDKAFPPLGEALEDLAQTRPRCRSHARRMFAIATASRALAELREPGTDLAILARNALAIEGLAGGDEQAARLLELLVDDGLLGTFEGEPTDVDAWWDTVLERAAEEGVIEDPNGIGPRPCTGRLVWVKVEGQSEPVTTLKTVFETDLPFARVKQFCDPMRWTCFPFWCEMDDRGEHGGVHRYHEVVSFNCADKDNAWTVEVDLDFSNYVEDDVLAVTEYRLSPNQVQHRVLVNEGSLVMEQLGSDHGSRVRVTTTKRIKFSGSFDGPLFANVMCLLGYLGYVEDLLCCAADEKRNASFPGRRPGGPSDMSDGGEGSG